MAQLLGLVAVSADDGAVSQQAALCRGPWVSSGGRWLVHRSVAIEHRGANAQPGISSRSDGTMPRISCSRVRVVLRAPGVERRGIEPISPRV
jgi:hypothetical protein